MKPLYLKSGYFTNYEEKNIFVSDCQPICVTLVSPHGSTLDIHVIFDIDNLTDSTAETKLLSIPFKRPNNKKSLLVIEFERIVKRHLLTKLYVRGSY